MCKILSVTTNKNYKILEIDSIKKFLNIVSPKDDAFLEELYFSSIEFAENLLGICLGEKKYIIEYKNTGVPKAQINLKYNTVQKINSCKTIDFFGNEKNIENFSFSQETQKLFFKDYIFIKKSSIIVNQESKIDESYKNFESIKTKLLRHINILYKNRNSYIFQKNDIDSHIASIYQEMMHLLK